MGVVKNKLQQIEKMKDQAVKELQNEKSKNQQRVNQLERMLSDSIEQNKLMSKSLIASTKNSHLGINTHNLTDDSRGKIGDYSDLKQFNPPTTQSKISRSKYENIKKANGRSQSVLKSHTEFNHNFTNNYNTNASVGSSTTQRANF